MEVSIVGVKFRTFKKGIEDSLPHAKAAEIKSLIKALKVMIIALEQHLDHRRSD